MINRSFLLRLSKIDKRVSTNMKRREKKIERYLSDLLFCARHHAIAVAAIVLSGQPKIDEPLIIAWNRALQHYGIKVGGRGELDDQNLAAQQLAPLILGGKESSARFTEIFAAAPVWLIQFTALAHDARFLKFDLPNISMRLSWGGTGYEDARRWPLLPLGTMTSGEPIPNIDPRQVYIAYNCVVGTGDAIQALRDSFSGAKGEELSKTNDPLVDEMIWASDLLEKPEEEWPPHERRRMRKHISRLMRYELNCSATDFLSQS